MTVKTAAAFLRPAPCPARRELDGHGVIHRRELAPPAASRVYELTRWGRELEPIVLALGTWGVSVPLPATPTTLGATSVLLFLRSRVPAELAVALTDGRASVTGDGGALGRLLSSATASAPVAG